MFQTFVVSFHLSLNFRPSHTTNARVNHTRYCFFSSSSIPIFTAVWSAFLLSLSQHFILLLKVPGP